MFDRQNWLLDLIVSTQYLEQIFNHTFLFVYVITTDDIMWVMSNIYYLIITIQNLFENKVRNKHSEILILICFFT